MAVEGTVVEGTVFEGTVAQGRVGQGTAVQGTAVQGCHTGAVVFHASPSLLQIKHICNIVKSLII